MAPRMLSASSINTFRQCPRKFYYQYIKKLKTMESIHLIRGSIVHTVLERIYDLDPTGVDDDQAYAFLGRWMLREFKKEWALAGDKLRSLGLSGDQLLFYFEESRVMLRNWLNHLLERLNEADMPFDEAFLAARPVREKKLISEEHKVLGFVDVIEMVEDKIVKVIDYKTSAKDAITPEYELQLSIYALLINETYGYPPEEVAIHFLRHGERSIKVYPEFMEMAKKEIAWVLERIADEGIDNYPKKVSPLCKWENARGSGQCDFYEYCFGQKRLDETI